MYETIQVKILGWFLRAVGFKVLIRFNHVSSVSYQQGGYIQGRSIIFPNKEVEVTKKFLFAKLHQYFGNFDLKIVPRREKLKV